MPPQLEPTRETQRRMLAAEHYERRYIEGMTAVLGRAPTAEEIAEGRDAVRGVAKVERR